MPIQSDAQTLQFAENGSWSRFQDTDEMRGVGYRDGAAAGYVMSASVNGGRVSLYVEGGMVRTDVEVGPFGRSADSDKMRPAFVRYATDHTDGSHEIYAEPDPDRPGSYRDSVCGLPVKWANYAMGYYHIDEAAALVRHNGIMRAEAQEKLNRGNRRKFWSNAKQPTASGYEWLMSEWLYVMLLSVDGECLVYDESYTAAAVLDTEYAPSLEQVMMTVNGVVINFHDMFSRLMNIVTKTREAGRTSVTRLWSPVNPPEDSGIVPGQPNDNIVSTLSCGHEVDSMDELPPGLEVHCAIHGMVEVVS